jgi:hypothetical protein
MVLDEVERSERFQFRKLPNQGLKVGMMLKKCELTIIISKWILIFPLLWFVFLWCKSVCYWYIGVSQALAQAMVALVNDLQIWPYVYVSDICNFSHFFYFSLFRVLWSCTRVWAHFINTQTLLTAKAQENACTLCIALYAKRKFLLVPNFEHLNSLSLLNWKLGMLQRRSGSSRPGLPPASMRPLARSTCPLDCRW